MTGRAAFAVGLAGILGWAGLASLGILLFATHPPSAGFDLEVLLRAGRAVAAGSSPYDQAILNGTAPVAERLFYSYPPPVAQVLSLVAGLPSGLLLVAWDLAAVAAFAVAVRSLATRLSPDRAGWWIVATSVALVPLLFPFAIGLLFGNLDVFFPWAFGLMAIAAVSESGSGHDGGRDDSGRARALGGVGLALASLTKVGPALVGVWFLARALRRPRLWTTVAVALVVGGLIVGLSVVLGGTQPWLDYGHLLLVRVGSAEDLVDPRNAGPATQLALLVGGDAARVEGVARAIQTPIAIGAVMATLVAAWRIRDPLASVAVGAAASLVVLPVTWYHYPAALIPFGLAALLRSAAAPRRSSVVVLMILAGVLTALAITWLPLLWVAVVLLVAGVVRSRPPAGASVPEGIGWT